jgi:hypothetical protein
MLVFSALGLAYHGYFFAFHLFNIIDNNPLLAGVIKAVTLNGKVKDIQVCNYICINILLK